MRRELTGGFELDDDRVRIDVDAVHTFISTESYWGLGRARETIERTIAGSTRVVGLYRIERVGREQQIGFARAISDGVSLAYLADVYVLRPYRGRGLGLELVREIVERSFGDVRWMLHTADAQRLYEKLGFSDGRPPYPLMERPASRLASGAAPRR
ncbi:MAG TPA: GNAT family N-acetyltransferase [Solirubrobacteraceae bacterium]|nr:GNAT family N-acetyltransferase [Solirubrobacteraceae bacterium]